MRDHSSSGSVCGTCHSLLFFVVPDPGPIKQERLESILGHVCLVLYSMVSIPYKMLKTIYPWHFAVHSNTTLTSLGWRDPLHYKDNYFTHVIFTTVYTALYIQPKWKSNWYSRLNRSSKVHNTEFKTGFTWLRFRISLNCPSLMCNSFSYASHKNNKLTFT